MSDPDALHALDRQVGFLSARSRESRRLHAAIPSGHPHDQRAEDSLDQIIPGLSSTAPGTAGRWITGCPPTARPTGANAPYVMGYHTRADIPFQFALAEAFTICDAYHCSVMGPTWPNRMYWMTGTIDADGEDGGPMISNDEPTKDGFPLDDLRRAAREARRSVGKSISSRTTTAATCWRSSRPSGSRPGLAALQPRHGRAGRRASSNTTR